MRGGEPPGRALRIAHRGDHRQAAENTLAAFAAALALPTCDGLEFDVRVSRDGVPVVIHDATLRRVQRRRGRVSAMPLADLLDAGIPSLAAVLELAGHARGERGFLDVELKGTAPGAATTEVLRAHLGEAPPHAVVSSFEPSTLEVVGRLLPGYGRWLNALTASPRTVAAARRLGCRGLSVDWRAIDDRAAERAREADLDLAAWTVTDPGVADRLAALGVRVLCVEGAALDATG